MMTCYRTNKMAWKTSVHRWKLLVGPGPASPGSLRCPWQFCQHGWRASRDSQLVPKVCLVVDNFFLLLNLPPLSRYTPRGRDISSTFFGGSHYWVNHLLSNITHLYYPSISHSRLPLTIYKRNIDVNHLLSINHHRYLVN